MKLLKKSIKIANKSSQKSTYQLKDGDPKIKLLRNFSEPRNTNIV